jgi:tripeptidyl-peptidase-1
MKAASIFLAGLVVFMTIITNKATATDINDQSNGFHFMESTKSRRDFEQKERADGETSHEVMIAIQKNNMPEFQAMVLDRATPGSPNYQKWFKFNEVTEMVQNLEAYDRVSQWLADSNVTITDVSLRKDYIHAVAPIKKWEELLNAEFYVFHDHSYRLGSGRLEIDPTTFLRCLSYSIPKHLKDDITAILHTVQSPIAYHKSFHMKEEDPEHGFPLQTRLRVDPMAWSTTTQLVTVPYLNKYYKIESNLGDPSLNQSVFQTSTEYFSQEDLLQFQQKYSLTEQRAISIGGRTITKCPTSTSASQSCFEGNLDIQYIMGVAQQTASIFWYIPRKSGVDSFAVWVTKIANDETPPQSNSMSWGAIEQVSVALICSDFYFLTY